jgi:hypothetical protein
MCGTRLKRNTLIKYANEVLAGKKKFIGTTKNDSFRMVNDNTDVISKYSLFFENTPEIKEVEKPVNSAIKKIRAYKKQLNRSITKNDYGWLNPEGKFYPVGWGDHDIWARNYIEKHFKGVDTDDPFFYCGDFLVKNKWLLLHNPCMGVIYLQDEKIKSASKKQKEFLYDYFIAREMFKEAKSIWMEAV